MEHKATLAKCHEDAKILSRKAANEKTVKEGWQGRGPCCKTRSMDAEFAIRTTWDM